MIETGSVYAELKGIMVRGTCEVIEGADAVQDAFAAMVETRGGTYSRPAGAASSAPKRVVLKIVAGKTMTWDHVKLGGRY
jgi:hypothetical protein